MQPRINLGKTAPAVYKALSALDRAAAEYAAAAGLGAGLTHLLRLRASQINQCAYCVRLHTRDALAAGESADRIAVLPAWRETGYFDAEERAALALCEAITTISEGQVPEAVYSSAREVLSAEWIAATEWLAIAINAWNRVAISSRYPVGP